MSLNDNIWSTVDEFDEVNSIYTSVDIES
jgi:hypothetical protein